MLGGVFAIIVSFWTSSLLGDLIPAVDIPIKLVAGLDATVLVFALGISLLTGMLFGLTPALQASRSDLVMALNDESGRSSGGRSRGRLRNTLVVAQISLSLMLLISAGLFVRSLREAQAFNPGFNPDNVLLSSLNLFPNGYSREEGHTFFRQLLARLENLPGVESAALARAIPMALIGSRDRSFRVDGYEPGPNERVWAYYNFISPNYFRTMEIQLISGRELTLDDNDEQPNVIIISRRMAEQYWKGRDPIGQQINFGSYKSTIVGVVENTVQRFVNEDPVRQMYFPFFQSNRQDTVIHLRTKGDPTKYASAIREEVRALDPSLPVFSVRTLRRTIRISSIQQIMAGRATGVFGLLALGLASVGIYGVLAYAVNQRFHEIGIRMALGAGKFDVLKLVLRQGLMLTVIGSVIGLAGAFGMAQLMSSLLFGVSTFDPLTYIGTTGLLGVVSLLACYIPPRRAAKVDPMVALRYE